MTEIAVYVEGGGNSKEQKAELRRGFDGLFACEKARAGGKRSSLSFVCCGGRQEAYEAFRNAINVRPERVNALLVDSESSIAPVPENRAHDAALRRSHLMQTQGGGGRGQGDGWPLGDIAPARIHLMVQCMEAWICADPETLEGFYKQNFKRARLPVRPNLEDESKADLYAKLEAATAKTQKGKYGKIQHGGKLLGLVRPEKVANLCPRFVLFREWLNSSIDR